MDTHVKTPQEVFSQPQHLQVPVFQRRYVWTAEAQWEPLWNDIRHVAEERLARQAMPHFLGAVVTQTSGAGMGLLATHALIDGQQRLTTLQLVIDAASAELDALGMDQHAARLHTLTHNHSAFGAGEDLLKLQHLNDDRRAFVEVMSAEPPIVYADLPDSRVTQAHAYFAEQVREWLGEDVDVARSEALVGALTTGLQIVVISLNENEQSQEIFETLNARGTPLTAADLIKNFVFQQIAEEGGDVNRAFRERWRDLEQKFWTDEVAIGRYRMERISLFLNHWLVAQTGDEVSTRSTFSRFQRWFRAEQARPMTDILESLHAQAMLYENWARESWRREGDLDPLALFMYRTESAEIESVKPLVLWLYDVDRALPADIAGAALRLVESWVMRRALLRLAASEYSRITAGLIAGLADVEVERLVATLEQLLRDLNRPASYWPGDREVRELLRSMPVYRQPKARLRVYLEAVEDHMRGYSKTRPASEGRVRRNYMTIEHLLPRKWGANWPVSDLAQEINRDEHVHVLGNLTLLTQSMNSAVSNGPWLGPGGKREVLNQSDTLLMTRKPRDLEVWDEQQIDARGSEMIDALLATWPAPSDHDPTPLSQSQERAEFLDLWVRDLVAQNLLAVGTVLSAGTGPHATATATVQADGSLVVDGETYWSPSGAAKAVNGRNTNGWTFWRLPDGRRLRELKRVPSSGVS